MSAPRFPTYFLSHGGGPWPYMKGPMREHYRLLERSLQDLPAQLPERPRAVLVVTGHWEEDAYTVSSSPAPGMVFDYYGFPEYLYHIQYPAPGAPTLAERVRGLLSAADLPARADAERGFDHGTFSMMKPIYPDADMPIVQLSLRHGYDPAEHWRAGQALAPLRDEGILIVGSGLSYHNLSKFGPAGAEPAMQFDGWLRQTLAAGPEARREALMHWAQAPSAREAHPREDHLIPLMVVLGAAQDDPAVCVYGERFMGVAASSFRFGADRTPTAFDELAA
ncbi:class III extradiol ring-cleavage dioxygenase [Oleiagrimonas sp. MCCC 1A03011]|uniref:DODA-type extradiol aromatic ring-opening family dioxygenase n=1 Tax=Oleiagrimonas sp. MCCC 1A03011 TaxID=1926883 RepID=UPI000DC4B8F8|nr:class III extradiol ring-cleavage dioxygenase [Oleiagrimonas sp. MCCC 1A03011]RAP57096.1 dioxygenase [Oleiagrimonas sp. MCCC 1A03011]